MQAKPKANVLLVDDQPANLQVLEAILEDLQQNLVLATSGEDALRRVLDDDFAVILLDVKMPGLDGLETARLIRGRERSAATPIIFLTAFERSEVQMGQGYSLGAVDYLFKPLQPEVLRSKVSVFVDLYLKTEQVKAQAEQLRENERRELERRLAEERREWELERLREEAAREKKIAGELAEADRRKDEFLAMLAHELRNPLAPIMTALELIRTHGEDRTILDRSRGIAERQVRHMTRLIDDLLDISRVNRGTIQLRQEAVDLNQVVARAVESCMPLIQSRQHELTVELPPGPVALYADPTRLEQVLSNLLNNAAKYTEMGGRIQLRVRTDDGQAVIVVRDNGIGIPPPMLDRIFELFTQVDRSLSSHRQWGMGIGLALVRTLVTMHGGSVSAHSAGPGTGSELVVRLPLLRAAAPAAALPEPSASQQGGPCPPARILVVDDNVDAAHSLALMLQLQGHDVVTASDGEEALEAARLHRPEVVLLDIGLPKIDGYEVATRLRQDEGNRDLYLIAMTGYGQEEDRRRSREAGFNCHLVKPVDPETIEELLAHRRGPTTALSGPVRT